VPLRYIQARRRHDSCVIAIGEGVNDFAGGVLQVCTVTRVAQPIANAAIGYKDYSAAIVREISEKGRASGDHGVASWGQSQRWKNIAGVVVAYFPAGQFDNMFCAVE